MRSEKHTTFCSSFVVRHPHPRILTSQPSTSPFFKQPLIVPPFFTQGVLFSMHSTICRAMSWQGVLPFSADIFLCIEPPRSDDPFHSPSRR